MSDEKKLAPEDMEKVTGGLEEEINLGSPYGMEIRCPNCGNPDLVLDTDEAVVDYRRVKQYRCHKCRHIFDRFDDDGTWLYYPYAW